MREVMVGGATILVDSPEPTGTRPPLELLAAAWALAVEASALVAGRRCPECGSADHGQPFVEFADGRASGCWVSVARSTGFETAAARLGGPVGIDIESRSGVVQHPVAATLLHPTEAVELEQLDRASADARLASLWVAKEALLKAAGTGLRIDPRGIRLDVSGNLVSVRRWPAELALTTSPHITLFDVTDDIVGALAEL